MSAATTGDEPGPRRLPGRRWTVGYRTASINGSVMIGGLTAGEHEVALSGVADNCGVDARIHGQ